MAFGCPARQPQAGALALPQVGRGKQIQLGRRRCRRWLTAGWLKFSSGAARTVLPLNSIRSNTRTSLSALDVR